jgi:hypothetical protein
VQERCTYGEDGTVQEWREDGDDESTSTASER